MKLSISSLISIIRLNKKRHFLIFLILFLIPLNSYTQIISTTIGGDWNNPSTWIGNIIPGKDDDVQINGPVMVKDSSYCKNVEITNIGTLDHSGYSDYIFINGNITNNGTVQGTGFYYIYGNIINNGEWSPEEIYLGGRKGHHFSCLNNSEFKDSKIEPISSYYDSIIADTDLFFNNVTLRNFEKIVLQTGNNLTLAGGLIEYTTIIDDGNTLTLLNNALLHGVDIITSTITFKGNVKVETPINIEGNVILQDSLQPRDYLYASSIIKINGNFTNNGVLKNNNDDYALHLRISGNIINNGIWTTDFIFLTGSSEQRISCGLNGKKIMGGHIEIADSFNTVYIEDDLKIENTRIQVDKGKLVIIQGKELTISGNQLVNSNIYGQKDSKITMIDSAVILSSSVSNVILGGLILVKDLAGFKDKIILQGEMKPYVNNARIIIDGEFTNNGIITEVNQSGIVDRIFVTCTSGKIINNGTFVVAQMIFENDSIFHISCSNNNAIKCEYLTSDTLPRNVFIDSDIIFYNSGIPFAFGTFTLKPASTFHLSGTHMSRITIDGNFANLLMSHNPPWNGWMSVFVTLRNLNLYGKIDASTNTNFEGEITLYDTLISTNSLQYSTSYADTSWLNINGNFKNNGFVNYVYEQSPYPYIIALKGNVTNNGTWLSDWIWVNGDTNQTINIIDNEVIHSLTYLCSNINGNSYQWYLDDTEIPNSNSEIHILDSISTYEFGIYKCISDLDTSRIIKIGSSLGADFVADIRNAPVGTTIQFTDLSSQTVTSWKWDFNNDNVIDSEEENPQWVYPNTGIYDVSLQVASGGVEDVITKEKYIQIVDSVSIIPQNIISYSNELFPPAVNRNNYLNKIKYSIANNNKTNVKILLYDISGRLIKILIDKVHRPGLYTIDVDYNELSNGFYFLLMKTGSFKKVQKMIFIK